MIKAYGRASSVNVQAVTWCLSELGMSYEQEEIGGRFGGNDSEQFLLKNPMGLVPVIQDGATTLWESSTILRYLMRQYGDHPDEPAEAAVIEKWADWTRAHVYPHLNTVLFVQLVRVDPSFRDHVAIAQSEEKLDGLMQIAGLALQNGAFGGYKLNVADFAFGVLLHRYFRLDFKRRPPAQLPAYYDRLCQRPAYQKIVMRDVFETSALGGLV